MTAIPTWPELKALMSDGPDLPLRGTIRDVDAGEAHYIGWSGDLDDPGPVMAGPHGTDTAVWRVGDRLRLEDLDGHVAMISDGRTTWRFREPGSTPLERPAERVLLSTGATALLLRPDDDRWRGDDFTRPTGPVSPTTHLGRRAWTVELAPPAHKPWPLQWVVDAETGLLLRQANDRGGVLTEWVGLVVGEQLDASLFTWDGPVVTWEEQRLERRREREAEDRAREERTLHLLGLTSVVVPVRSRVELLEEAPDGTLRADIDEIGSLRRRPRSDEPWNDEQWGGVDDDVHRWSDDRWDWAVQPWGSATLADGALAALERQLSGGAG